MVPVEDWALYGLILRGWGILSTIHLWMMGNASLMPRLESKEEQVPSLMSEQDGMLAA